MSSLDNLGPDNNSSARYLRFRNWPVPITLTFEHHGNREQAICIYERISSNNWEKLAQRGDPTGWGWDPLVIRTRRHIAISGWHKTVPSGAGYPWIFSEDTNGGGGPHSEFLYFENGLNNDFRDIIVKVSWSGLLTPDDAGIIGPIESQLTSFWNNEWSC